MGRCRRLPLPGRRPSFSSKKGEAAGAAERLVEDLDPVARSDGVAEPDVWDVVVGTALVINDELGAMRRWAVRALAPALAVALHPPLIPVSRRPAVALEALSQRGRAGRARAGEDLTRLVSRLVPLVVEFVLDQISTTAVLARHVDLDALVAGVDLDAVASRLDVNAVAGRVDVLAVLDRIDVTEFVRERLDLDAVAVDLDVDAIAARMDLDAVAGRLDVDAVIERIDLIALAETVIDAIDLPEIIRQSTASVTSDGVRGLRMQSIEADEAVSRLLDRLLPPRRRIPDGEERDAPATEPESPR